MPDFADRNGLCKRSSGTEDHLSLRHDGDELDPGVLVQVMLVAERFDAGFGPEKAAARAGLSDQNTKK